MNKEQFLRTEMLLGQAAMNKLAACHVAVVGLGGVGGYAAEALARAGIGAISLVDHDTFSVSNINRQAGAFYSTVGRHKADAMAERLMDINPELYARPLRLRYSSETRDEFFSVKYDYIVDAIDLVSCKLDLIESSLERGIPIISALGTGNKIDSTAFRVTDISKTEGCPLARIIRKELRSRGILHHTVVFSSEPAAAPLSLEEPPPGRRSIPASVSWVPGAAGFALAGHVIMELAKK